MLRPVRTILRPGAIRQKTIRSGGLRISNLGIGLSSNRVDSTGRVGRPVKLPWPHYAVYGYNTTRAEFEVQAAVALPPATLPALFILTLRVYG